MPSYYRDGKRRVWIKQCSCCKTEIIGTKNEEESIKIFQEHFGETNNQKSCADGMQSRCKDCNSSRRKRLGITLEHLRDMHQAQEGVCGICGTPLSLDRGSLTPACVDHDAVTGKVRQLLCRSCNSGLGQFYDNPEWLRMAADYIEFHKAKHAKEPSNG
jgi:Recombination endonuclease VII